MSEVEPEVTTEDPGYDRSRQRINLGIHPLGGVSLEIVDPYGHQAIVQLDQQMLAQITLTLITMNVMLTQQAAAANAMAAESLPKDLWTPNG